MSDAQKLIADAMRGARAWQWRATLDPTTLSEHLAVQIDKALGGLTREQECESSAELREDVDPDVDSDCTVHGVSTWSAHGGHDVVHYCTDACPEDCNLEGEETGEWCCGPLEMRTPRSRWVSGWSEAQP